MTFSFNTSLSGLNANSNALNVVGNNIANANTIGFRSSSITFADIFASSHGARLNGAGNSMQIGNGVRTGAIHTNFQQGNLNESGSPLHAAIQGNGFFVVKNADGTCGYTRAGDFTVNNQGFLVASNGGQVQGLYGAKRCDSAGRIADFAANSARSDARAAGYIEGDFANESRCGSRNRRGFSFDDAGL